MKSISAEKLLAIGGILMFFSGIIFYTWKHDPEAFVSIIPYEVIVHDPFRIGEHYFNHSDSPTGDYDLIKARKYYTEALKENPTGYLTGWYQLGRIDFLEGRFPSAIYKFDNQIKYFGDMHPNVYYMRGLTYAYQAQQSEDPLDWENAENDFKKFLEYFPKSPWPRTDLSWIYFSEGKFEDMLPVLEEGLIYNPDHPWLLNMYGLALMNTDRTEEAHDAFLKAETHVSSLTVTDWGKAYPGNDPSLWGEGLESFKEAIQKNILLSEAALLK